jgi:hypothetical protein
VYLDDVIVMRRTFHEHLLNLRSVPAVQTRFGEVPASLPSTVKAKKTIPMHFRDDYAGKSLPIATKSKRGRQAGMICCGCRRSWLEPSRSKERTTDQDIGPILEEVKANRAQNGKTSLTAAPRTKATGPSGNLSLRNGILESHWEPTDERSKTVQIVLPQG